MLEDLKAAIPARLDLTNDDQPGLSLGYDFSDCLSGSNLLPTILHYLHYYSEHCAVILEALQYPQANTIVGCFLIVMEQCLISFDLKDIVGITPAEYMTVLAFTSEERDFEVQSVGYHQLTVTYVMATAQGDKHYCSNPSYNSPIRI